MDVLSSDQQALFASSGSLQDYEVLKPIGKGKFAVVYKARRIVDGRIVALKKVAGFDILDERSRRKTLKEVQLVQRTQHPNLIQYMDCFLDDKKLYITFEWADVGDLKRQLRKARERGTRFDEQTIWRYFLQLTEAVLYLHANRIMHRDLKPANIFLTSQGILKVGDLGLGRLLGNDTMQVKSKVGTPLYMSPEVLRGEGYDWKSDVWSLGCILYELATLRSPFKEEGLNLAGLFEKINKGEYEGIPNFYSNELRLLVDSMLQLKPKDRPTVQKVKEVCLEHVRPSDRVEGNQTKENRHTKSYSSIETTKSITGTNGADADDVQSNPPPRPSSEQQAQRKQSDRIVVSRGTNDMKAMKRAEFAMERLYDRLSVLRYENLSSISRKHFVGDQRTSASSMFQDFQHLATWLFNCMDVRLKNDIDNFTKDTVAGLMLEAAVMNGVQGLEELSAYGLCSESGWKMCIFLDALSARVVTYRSDSILPVVSWPIDSIDADVMQCDGSLEVTPTADDDLDQSNDSTCSAFSVGDNMGSVRVKEDAAFAGEEETSHGMIQPTVEPTAWKLETAKLGDTLRNSAKAAIESNVLESFWRKNLAVLQNQILLIRGTKSAYAEYIHESQLIRTSVQDQLAQRESIVNDQMRRSRRHYYEFNMQLEKVEKQKRSIEERLERLVLTRDDVDRNAKEIESSIRAEEHRLSNDHCVVLLKQHLRALMSESHDLAKKLLLIRHQVTTSAARRMSSYASAS